MNKSINTFVAVATMALAAAAQAADPFAGAPDGIKFEIRNPIDVERTETVSLAWKDLGISPNDRAVRVWDVQAGKALPHQDGLNGSLLFSISLSGKETRRVVVTRNASLRPAEAYTVCWCDYVPERMDDFAWENDCFAARAYGPVIMEPAPKGQKLVSSGIDIFNKCVRYPVMDKWLRHSAGEVSYHKNHGEGMDNYKVGPSRGCGGIGAFASGKWSTSANWAKQRVIQTGPVRCEFELVYRPWGGLGDETRRVTLDRGQSFAAFTATFADVPDGILAGPGLDIAAKRSHAGSIALSQKDGWIANFEPEDGANGSIMTGILLAPCHLPAATVAEDGEDCLYLLVRPCQKVRAVSYYAGANWTLQGRFTTAAAWHAHVRDFALALRSPVEVVRR